jgi:hypothetical protein
MISVESRKLMTDCNQTHESGYSVEQQATCHRTVAANKYYNRHWVTAHRRVILFHKSTNDSQRCESEVLKRTGFGCGVQKWVQKQRDVSLQEELACLGVRRNTLKESQCIANSIRCLSIKLWRLQLRIYQCDLLHNEDIVSL